MSKIENANGIYSHMFLVIKLSFIETFAARTKTKYHPKFNALYVFIGHTILSILFPFLFFFSLSKFNKKVQNFIDVIAAFAFKV